MEKLKTDILVIGAGPAGGSAALAARRHAVSVLIVERKKNVGRPVQCAEFIPAMMLGELTLGAQGNDKSFIVQKIKGMKTFIKGKLEKETKAPGFIINRDVFDQKIVKEAKKNGARLLTSTKAVSMTPDKTIILKQEDNVSLEVDARVIIAADGPNSRVGQWLNIPPVKQLPGVQMAFALKEKSEFTQIYLEPEIHAGYSWLFPKGDIANVGLGFKKTSQNMQTAVALLKQFVSQFKKRGIIMGEPLSHRAGWIPAESRKKAVYGNILFAGDAAGHTHPITGAGIFTAVACGKMAGERAACAVLKNDLSILLKYDEQWQEMFGRTLNHAVQKRLKMEAEWENFDKIIRSCWIAFREYYV